MHDEINQVIELSESSPLFRGLLPALLQSTKGVTATSARFRRPFDVIIRCFGWNMDRSIFDPSSIEIQMNTNAPKKYPALTKHFESPKAKHLFFLGSNAHGHDKFRFASAGGFIHGFRYIARALHQLLLSKYEGVERLWEGPQSTEYEWTAPHNPPRVEDMTQMQQAWPSLWKRLMRRINEASGPYQAYKHVVCMSFLHVA